MEVGVDTQSEIEMLKGRNTVAECYTKILTDLDDAENLIPAATAAKNKATKSAAIALKQGYIFIKRLGKCNY
jgi:hypothetical protein